MTFALILFYYLIYLNFFANGTVFHWPADCLVFQTGELLTNLNRLN